MRALRKRSAARKGLRAWKKKAGKIFKKRRRRRFGRLPLLLFISAVLLASCVPFGADPDRKTKKEADFVTSARASEETLRIVSGSENRMLEGILEDFSKEEKINIELTYQGSLDIMRLLSDETIPYDAVWPASSLWLSIGDEQHRVKHLESTSSTPVIFGIKQSLAEDLGFVGRDVYVRDILEAIQSGRLKFTMTSATQSNSGASAYIGFIYALLDSPKSLTSEDLEDPHFQEEMKALLAGTERSSGSSDWLKELYLNGDYDAMVNYEALIISANQTLEAEGRETLYAVYPVDGMMIANSPLGFVSGNGEARRNEKKKEEAFLKLQDYLLSDAVQAKIQRTGRRTGMNEVSPENSDVFRKDWGIDTERVIGTINMPRKDVLLDALNLYQRSFKKPGLNIYVLDFSGSMAGRGREELLAALGEIMIDEKASRNFLQASDDELNVFIPFNYGIKEIYTAEGSRDLEGYYDELEKIPAEGGTALYEALIAALNYLSEKDLSYYSPSVIVMSDGLANGTMTLGKFSDYYEKQGADIPIFSILFGDASEGEMESLAEMSRARVFDGREDLTAAFRSVRGYN